MTIDDVFAEFVEAACVPLDHASPDGKRFLMIRRDEGSAPRQLNVILNGLVEPSGPWQTVAAEAPHEQPEWLSGHRTAARRRLRNA